MSFAYFDNILVLLSEEINVPIHVLKEAWTNSFLKFYKADATILTPVKKVAATKDKTTESPKPEKETNNNKLVACQEDGCIVKVKNVRPIDGKIYCSKHYKKAFNSINKAEAVKCSHIFPPKSRKAGQPCGNNAIENMTFCKIHTPLAPSSEVSSPVLNSSSNEDEDEHKHEHEDLADNLEDNDEDLEEEEDEEEIDTAKLLVDLNSGLKVHIGKNVTSENYNTIATMDKYLVFFELNWKSFIKIYPNLISIEELKLRITKKKITKWDLYSLLDQRNPKLENSE
jgi:hypothetical protein